jgi:hypothetical protein
MRVIANTGAAAGGILFLLTYLPYVFIQFRYYDMSTGEKMASALLHNVAMCYGCYQISLAEGRGYSITTYYLVVALLRNVETIHIKCLFWNFR